MSGSTVTLTSTAQPRRPSSSRARRWPTSCARTSPLTGTHLGCEHGVCGACTVLLDGDGGALLPDVRRPGRRRRGRHRRGPGPGRRRSSATCSRRCTSATACSAASARRASSCRSPRCLRAQPDPDDDEIRDGLSGNLCRCTGYQGIVDAVRRGRRRGGSGHDATSPTHARRRATASSASASSGARTPACVTGHGTYVDDVVVPGMLHVAFLRSDIARGTITDLDVDAPRASCPASSPCSPAPTSTATSRERWVDFEGRRRRPAVPRAWPTATSASSASRSPSSSPSRATSPRTPAT